MRIEGNYTFGASPEFVWSLLQDPVTIRQALPGCEEFDQIASTEYIATIRIQQGPFKGRYQGQVQLLNDVQHDRFALTVDGEGPEGTVSGNGMLYLDEQDGFTLVRYAGDVDVVGHTAEESPRMIQTIANSLIRRFFESIDRQVQIQTGIHTTSLPGDIPRSRPSVIEEMQAAAAEIKQDRRTLWIVLALMAFVFYSFTSLFVFLLLLVRWGKRTFERRVATAVHNQQQGSESLDRAE